MRRILITGPPRSGTTLMLYFFHNLGRDIGYKESAINNYWNQKTNGMEWMMDKSTPELNRLLSTKSPPKVIKEPFRLRRGNTITVLDHVIENNWRVESLICCFRLDRRKALKSYINMMNNKLKLPSVEDQVHKDRYLHMVRSGSECFLRHVTQLDLNPIFIEYPKFKLDFDYFYKKISNIVSEDKETILDSWNKSIDKSR